MHYRDQTLSRPPLSTRSPNSPADRYSVTAQRSSATCSLSLTSVSASGKAGSIDSTSCSVASGTSSDATAMLVDSCSTSLVTVPSTTQPKKKVPVPFPKRPHSLLRSAASTTTRLRAPAGDLNTVPFVIQDMEDQDENMTLLDSESDDHPRKRTRTSAFSSSDSIRLWRSRITATKDSSNSHSRHSKVDVTMDGPSATPVPPKKPRSHRPMLKTMKSSQQDEAILLLSCLSSQPLVPYKLPILSILTPSPQRRHRRAPDHKSRVILHKALTRGLARKYPPAAADESPTEPASSSVDSTEPSCLSKFDRYIDLVNSEIKSNPTPGALYAMQDVLLAVRLERYLISHSISSAGDPEGSEPGGSRTKSLPPTLSTAASASDGGDLQMVVDEEVVPPEVRPQSVRIRQADKPKSSSPRARSPPLSHPQLVATLTLRHFNPSKEQTRRSSLVRCPRARSSLASGSISATSY